jgi:hypothetical protein
VAWRSSSAIAARQPSPRHNGIMLLPVLMATGGQHQALLPAGKRSVRKKIDTAARGEE